MNELVEAAIESVWRHHLAALDEALDESIRGLQNLLRLDEHHRHGHEAPQLTRSLGPFGSAHLDLTALSQVLDKRGGERVMTEERLQRVNGLLEALIDWRAAFAEPPSTFPGAELGEDEAAVHEKAAAHLNRMAGAFRDLRIAQQEIRSKFTGGFEDFDWRKLSRAELRLCPPFVIRADLDEDSSGKLRRILALLESRKPFKIIASRSTLRKIYASAADPSVPAHLATEMTPLALRGVYFLQASAASDDFSARLFDGLGSPRPGLLSLLVPGDGEKPSVFRLRSERALRARAFPAVVYDPDRAPGFVACFDLSGNPPEADALSFADFAAGDPEFAGQFSAPPEGAGEDALLPVSAYLALTRRQRLGKWPCVVSDTEAGECRRVLSPELVTQISDQSHLWRTLQELSGINNPFIAASTAALASERDAREKAAVEKVRGEMEAGQKEREQAAVAAAVREIVARFTGVDASEINL